MLSVRLASLRLRNPVMNASGILGLSASTLAEAARHAGAVVTKSLGNAPLEGYPNPTVVVLETGLLNAIGLSNPGVDAFAEEVREYRSLVKDVPLICSIFARDPDSFADLARKVMDLGVDALELNLSCPHVRGHGAEIGAEPDRVREITAAVRSACGRFPLFVKVTPNTRDVAALAAAAEDGGADAIVAINTLRAMKIDIWFRRPVLASPSGIGGYSGKGVLPVGVRCVHEIFERVDIPIVGVGGISRWEDAVEYMLAGAAAVQVGTALECSDWSVLDTIVSGLEAYLKKEGLGSVQEIVGAAHTA